MTPERDLPAEDDVSLPLPTPTPTAEIDSEKHIETTQDGSVESVNKRMPFMDDIGIDMVDLYVGPQEKLFRIHKQRLCRRIPYFQKMFYGNFKEASESVARFPEDDPAAFDVLMEWNGYIATMSWDPVDVYSLAEKFCLADLQDTIMTVLLETDEFSNSLPGPSFIDRVYTKTSSESMLSRYCARSIQYVLGTPEELNYWPADELEKLFSDHPKLTSDYIKLQRTVAMIDPTTLDSCIFHLHGQGQPCVDDGGKKRKRQEEGDVEPRKKKIPCPKGHYFRY